jgi:hypothetical protein
MRVTPIIAFSVMLAGACQQHSEPVSRDQVGGVYVVRTGNVVDTLVVGSDGVFNHRLWDENGLAFVERGHWTMSTYPDGDTALEFDRITPIADRAGPHRSAPGVWLGRVGRTGSGAVSLMLNRDLGLSYVRQGSSR